MNKAMLSGRLTDEPRISTTTTGKKIARFNLAVNTTKDKVDYPGFIAWERSAEFIENWCHKGTKLIIEGHIQTGSYEKDGKKVYTTDIVCDRIEFAESKAKDGSEGQPTENQSDKFMDIPEGLQEELPFA